MQHTTQTAPNAATDRALKLVNEAMQILMGFDELATIERQEATTDCLRLLNSAKVALTDTPAERYDA